MLKKWLAASVLVALLAMLAMPGCNNTSAPESNGSAGPAAPTPAATLAAAPDKQPQTDLPRSTVVFGGRTFNVQIANTTPTRQKGYMFTRHIPDGEGMVFCFRTPQFMAFWNHNVPIALDLVFVKQHKGPGGDKFIIDAIHTMPAMVDDRFSSNSAVQYALEFAAGTAAALGVNVGDEVQLSDAIVAAAVTAD